MALLLQGWSGLWIEANAAAVAEIRRQGAPVIEAGRLNVLESFITRENINRLIVEGCRHREVDLLSIDIDGNDLHIFKAIECISPRVLVLEYNAKFPPPMEFCIEYDPAHGWTGDDYFGASLKSCEIACADRGYCLVGCSLTGANAFFVRQDLVQDLFVAPFTAETHYEPPRYHLTSTSSGHPVSFKSLAHAVVQR